jgi:hypothetical protein
MSVEESVARIEALLDSLAKIDLGYPQGQNCVFSPMPRDDLETSLERIGLASYESLCGFYAACDGVSLPDVHIGYFLHEAKKLGRHGRVHDINEVLGPFAGSVVIIGSTGGGDLFALRRKEGDVLFLPPGPVHAGAYDGARAAVRRLAADFESFLERIVADVEAFVHDVPNYPFMGNRSCPGE